MELTPAVVLVGFFVALSVGGAAYFIVKLAMLHALEDYDRREQTRKEQRRGGRR